MAIAEKLPVDPDAKLPPAVKKIAEQTDRRYKKEPIAAAPADRAEPIAPAPAPEPQVVVATPPHVHPTEATAPAPAPIPEESWQHRYNSMKGRYEQSSQTIQQLRDRLSNLEETLATVQAPPSPRLREQTFEPLITDKDVSEYGPDFLDVVRRQTKQELLPVVNELKNEVLSLKGELTSTKKTITKSTRAQMYAFMDQALPQWRELNDNQDFVRWLGLPDPFSGVIRHELLEAAHEQNDAPRVLRFFQGFLSEEAALSPAKAAQTAPQPPGLPAASPRETVSLADLAAPGRAKTTAAQPPVEKPYITRAQIAQFYADDRRGKYTPEEKLRYENMIFEARAEGRIIN